MNKRKRRRKTLRKILDPKPWHIIAFTILLTISMIQTLMVIHKIYFTETFMKYGDKDYRSSDDFECFNMGSKLTNTKAIICCYKYPFVSTTDKAQNISYDTTQCFKITNVTIINN